MQFFQSSMSTGVAPIVCSTMCGTATVRRRESAVQPEDADIAGRRQLRATGEFARFAPSGRQSRRVSRSQLHPARLCADLMSTRQKSFFDQDHKTKVC